jgi:hypothetical protein
MEAEKCGISRERLRNEVASRDVVRVLRGVYLRSDVVLDTMTKAAAASKVVSSHSVICDRTAAWLHGIDVICYAELESVPPLETYTFRGHRATNRPECSGGSRDLLAEDWQWIGGLRVTTPLRWRSSPEDSRPRRRSTGSSSTACRRTGSTSPIRTRAWSWSTTGRSTTPTPRRERDEARRDWLRRHKWHVIVVTKESFTAEACDEWVRELRNVLAERGALGRR